MQYLDIDEDTPTYKAVWTLCRSLLRGWVTADEVSGTYVDGVGLVYLLASTHHEGPACGKARAPGVYEAAEQFWHLIMARSDALEVRCRHCGLLDPMPAQHGYDELDPDDEIACVRCQKSDRLTHMRGVAPAPKPRIRARRTMMRARFGDD